MVYSFLADMNNHRQLMPENIIDWSSTADEVSFAIQNMAKFSLKITGRTENSAIKIEPAADAPFNMELTWTLQQAGEVTEVTYTIAAQLNMMMKMFAAGPLQKLADQETGALMAILN